MSYRFNVSCSETSAKRWTPTAVDCYKLGCRCSKCNLYNLYFKDSVFQCKMKESVIELIRHGGAPKFEEEEIEPQIFK